MPDATAADVDAITFLELQHEEIRRLFGQVQQATPDQKAEVFQCLVRLLAVHETAEEQVLHPAAKKAPNAETVVQARLAEESAAKQALADIEKMGVDSPEFDETFGAFKLMVDQHASNEESQEFPLVRAASDDATLATMGDQLRTAEKVAPSHPHPHGPDGAIANMVVGPFASIADRVRDTLTGKSA